MHINLQNFSKKASLLVISVIAFGLVTVDKQTKTQKSSPRAFSVAKVDNKKTALKN